MTEPPRCPQCSAIVRANAKFCNTCGIVVKLPTRDIDAARPLLVQAVASPPEPRGPGRRLLAVSGCLVGGGLVFATLIVIALSWWAQVLAQAADSVPVPT